MAQTFRDAIADAAKRTVCTALGASSAFGSALVSAWQGVTGINANPADFAGIAKGLLCDAPSPPFYDPPTSFGGAGCNCDIYYVAYSLKRRVGTNLDGFQRFNGPITSIRYRTNALGNTGLEFLCKGPAGSPCGGFTWVASNAGTSEGNVISYEINAVINETNPGDNCLPPDTSTPTPLPDTGINFPDVAFVFSPTLEVGSPVINASANINLFQPFIQVNGQLVVPFTLEANLNVGVGPFNVNGTVNINTGDVNIGIGGGSGGGGSVPRFPPSDCEDEDEPVRVPPPKPGPVPDKPEDPDVTEKTVISGVIVTSGEVDLQRKATAIAQGENPTIFAPALGFVNFFYEIGDEKYPAWSQDIPVKNQLQFISCPYEEGAQGVAGTPNPGVSWSLTPIYKKIRSQLPEEE